MFLFPRSGNERRDGSLIHPRVARVASGRALRLRGPGADQGSFTLLIMPQQPLR
jgi:hypothetical protein